MAISLLCTFFITYPNVMWIPWNLSNLGAEDELQFWTTFAFRCLFFLLLFYCQIRLNVSKLSASNFIRRFGKNILFSIGAGIIFVIVSHIVPLLGIQSATVGKHLTFQFLVVSLLCTFIGYIYEQNNEKRLKEQEIERLKIENLESRYKALVNQINPHFFFNSLNGISSLVQRGDEEITLDYISRLSDIFRYILQSDRKELVSLDEEIGFVRSFAYVMETRFGGKLEFQIDIPNEYLQMKVPVLSMLPLLENITVHNRIDSTHNMTVSIRIQEMCVIITNNVYPKQISPDTNGTGLENLNRRFLLMTGKEITTDTSEEFFRVYLPLIHA